MANLGYSADPNDLPEKGGDFELLTPGEYKMQAITADIRDTKKGGQMVVWEFNIIEGPKTGRKIWDNVNIANPPGYSIVDGKDPAKYGQQHNNQFAAAIGLVTGAGDTDNYLFKPVIGVVKVQKGTNGYGDSNAISAFKPASGGAAPRAEGNGATARTGATTSSAGNAGSGKPKAYKNPEDGAWYDEDGNKIPFFKLKEFEKVEG